MVKLRPERIPFALASRDPSRASPRLRTRPDPPPVETSSRPLEAGLGGHLSLLLYRSRMNSSLGRNFEAMDPLEWLARLADHIPDPGKHRTHF